MFQSKPTNESKDCYDLWKSDNLTIEICYAIVCLLFIFQAIYASRHMAKTAIQFDIVMAIGSSMPIAIYLDQHWLLQVMYSCIIIANFFIAYKLREMQNIGTSWVFVLVYMNLTLLWTILNFIGEIITQDCSSNHVFQAIGFAGLFLMQMINVFLIFTVR